MYGEPWCFSPALVSITADGADSVMTALEALISQILPQTGAQTTVFSILHLSLLLSFLCAILTTYYFLSAFFSLLATVFTFPISVVRADVR